MDNNRCTFWPVDRTSEYKYQGPLIRVCRWLRFVIAEQNATPWTSASIQTQHDLGQHAQRRRRRRPDVVEKDHETSQLLSYSCHVLVRDVRFICHSVLHTHNGDVSIFTPLIFSGIFYGSNGQNHISYIDSLFNCVSAMTVCGLATVDLSALTGWQQAILFIQMCIGSPVRHPPECMRVTPLKFGVDPHILGGCLSKEVSQPRKFHTAVALIYQPRHYFAIKFRHVLKANADKALENGGSGWPGRISTFLRKGRGDISITEGSEGQKYGEKKKGLMQKLRPEMIKRMDDEPKRINPSGLAVPLKKAPTMHSTQYGHLSVAPESYAQDYTPAPISRRSSIGYEGDRKKLVWPYDGSVIANLLSSTYYAAAFADSQTQGYRHDQHLPSAVSHYCFT